MPPCPPRSCGFQNENTETVGQGQTGRPLVESLRTYLVAVDFGGKSRGEWSRTTSAERPYSRISQRWDPPRIESLAVGILYLQNSFCNRCYKTMPYIFLYLPTSLQMTVLQRKVWFSTGNPAQEGWCLLIPTLLHHTHSQNGNNFLIYRKTRQFKRLPHSKGQKPARLCRKAFQDQGLVSSHPLISETSQIPRLLLIFCIKKYF